MADLYNFIKNISKQFFLSMVFCYWTITLNFFPNCGWCKNPSHKKTMTHNKKCTRTFHTKLDNKLRSFRAMKVNWFCQKQGFHFIICLLLRTLKDFRMNDCVLTHFHVTIWIQFAKYFQLQMNVF